MWNYHESKKDIFALSHRKQVVVIETCLWSVDEMKLVQQLGQAPSITIIGGPIFQMSFLVVNNDTSCLVHYVMKN